MRSRKQAWHHLLLLKKHRDSQQPPKHWCTDCMHPPPPPHIIIIIKNIKKHHHQKQHQNHRKHHQLTLPGCYTPILSQKGSRPRSPTGSVAVSHLAIALQNCSCCDDPLLLPLQRSMQQKDSEGAEGPPHPAARRAVPSTAAHPSHSPVDVHVAHAEGRVLTGRHLLIVEDHPTTILGQQCSQQQRQPAATAASSNGSQQQRQPAAQLSGDDRNKPCSLCCDTAEERRRKAVNPHQQHQAAPSGCVWFDGHDLWPSGGRLEWLSAMPDRSQLLCPGGSH